jgi:hypothetical protein
MFVNTLGQGRVHSFAKVGAGETAIFRREEAAGFTQRSDVSESFPGT